jgi:hypothetical protein
MNSYLYGYILQLIIVLLSLKIGKPISRDNKIFPELGNIFKPLWNYFPTLENYFFKE